MKRMAGVAIGLVSEVDAKLGRVRVKFPWMDPPQPSYWAPIAAPMSGNKRGVRFMPEPEDEALVAFDRGEFDHPYVVGFLWNGADEAPDNVVTNRLIVTPGGHELRFEDKDGDRRIVLKTAGGHVLTLDDKQKSVTLESTAEHQLEILDQGGTVTLTTKSGGKLTLEDQGKAVLQASENTITLEAGRISIRATGDLEVNSSGQTTINSTAPMTVKSAAMMNVEATGMMDIKANAALNLTASAALKIQASGMVDLTASMLNVTAPMAMFSGVVIASTVIASSVVSPTYTPGVGNLI